MKKITSVLLAMCLLATLFLPSLPASAVARTIVYRATDCVDAENSSQPFAEQAHNWNGTLTEEGVFSRFDGTAAGDYATYVLEVAAAGTYTLSIRYRAHETTAASSDLYVNGQKLAKSFAQTGSANNAYTADMGEVALTAGKNILRFEVQSPGSNGTYRLNLFTFTLSYDDGEEPDYNDGIPIGTVGGNNGAAGSTGTAGVVYNAIESQSAEYSSAAFASQTTGSYTFSRFDATAADAYATYIIHVAEAGQYKLLIRYRAHESVGKAHFYLNGEKQEKTFKSTGAANSYYQTSLGIYTLVEGDNYIQFKMYEPGSSGTYKLNLVDFTLAEPVEEELNGYTETPGASSDKVISYPFQSIYKTSAVFSVKADGVEIPVVAYGSDWYDYAQFSFKDSEQPIEIEVTYSAAITSYSISPLKEGIAGQVSGNKLTFTIDKSLYLILRLNGSNKRLVITADPPEKDAPAASGEGIFNVTEPAYGADRTGKESSYAALQKAVDDASAYGSVAGNPQGVVYVPSGVYFTGSLMLKSNVRLYLEGGAILRASRNEDDFAAKGRKNSLGLPITYLIYTENGSTNIKICGRGTVDGDGYNVRALGFALQTLAPVNTSYFTTDGITYRDSGMWSIVPAWSDHLEFLNIKILNTVKLGEDDGIDICGCQEVVVRHAIGIMWDDPFSTKAYTGSSGEISGGWGEGPGEINDNILFDDCVSWTGCYGFKVGQGVSRNHQNITFQNGTVYECAVGLGIHHKQGGAEVKNVTFENIDVESIVHQNDDHKTWFVAYIQAASGTGGPITDVTVKNINVRCASTSTPKLLGKAEDIPVRNVSFENITFQGSTGAATTLAQMGFTDELSKFSENCSVVNPANVKTPAEYASEISAGSVVNDSAAETGRALRLNADGSAFFPDLDFGDAAQRLNIRCRTSADATLSVSADSADSLIGWTKAAASEDYEILSIDLKEIAGAHDLYIASAGEVTVDWIQIYTGGMDDPDAEAAAAVDEQIRGIGEVTSLSQTGEVAAARAAYAALSDAAKALVTELQTLEAAEAKLAELSVKRGDVDGDGSVTVSDVVELRKRIVAGSWSDAELAAGNLDATDNTLTVSDVVALRALIVVGADV